MWPQPQVEVAGTVRHPMTFSGCWSNSGDGRSSRRKSLPSSVAWSAPPRGFAHHRMRSWWSHESAGCFYCGNSAGRSSAAAECRVDRAAAIVFGALRYAFIQGCPANMSRYQPAVGSDRSRISTPNSKYVAPGSCSSHLASSTNRFAPRTKYWVPWMKYWALRTTSEYCERRI